MNQLAPPISGNAYLLLEVAPGASDAVASRLTQLNPTAVPCAAAVWGQWDVVARITLPTLKELLDFVDTLRTETDNKISRTETWCVRDDQDSDQDSYEERGQPDRLAFVMLRVNPRGEGKLTQVLRYVRRPTTSVEGARVWHAAGVLGPYDIATTISYTNDVALTDLVMNNFQKEGRELGITDTLTIASIADMVYPKKSGNAETYKLFRDARELAHFGGGFSATFPKAARETELAGKCYEHGLGTASVFHLMRAMELGLSAVAASLEVTSETSWGITLDKIDKAIKRSTLPMRERRFFDTAYTSFNAFRGRYRNPLVHGEYDFDTEQAKEAFISTRNLMKTLASHMNERGQRI